MRPHRLLIRRLALPCPAAEAFAWHERPGALSTLIPPDEPVEIVEHVPGTQGPIGDGARVVLMMKRGPLRFRWVALHEGFVPNRRFIDVQAKGPFAFWKHTHTISPTGERSCVLEDHVEYSLPLGRLGDALAHRAVRHKLDRMFAWRHRATFDALVRADPDF